MKDQKFYDCLKAIDDTIDKLNSNSFKQSNERVENKTITDSLFDKHIMKNVEYIVANTIELRSSIEGRYSKANEDWAKNVIAKQGKGVNEYLKINNHPSLINEFCNAIQRIKKLNLESRVAKAQETKAAKKELVENIFADKKSIEAIKPTERAVNDIYKIADSQIIGDVEIALITANNSFGTVVCNVDIITGESSNDWFFGNYFENFQDAVDNYNDRINEEKGLLAYFDKEKPNNLKATEELEELNHNYIDGIINNKAENKLENDISKDVSKKFVKDENKKYSLNDILEIKAELNKTSGENAINKNKER